MRLPELPIVNPSADKHASLSQHLAADDAPWQHAMRDAVTDVDELFELLDLPTSYRPAAHASARLFGLRVPRGLVARMRPGDINDPLLRQVLPLAPEGESAPGFVIDAVGDTASASGDGLLHKYNGRALLITTGACAVHCRYCFRRHFDYGGQHAGGSHTRAALARIAADSSITEVILSGGDPLSLSSARLAELGRALDAIAHVARIRIHTRTAIVLPERVNAALVDWVAQRRAAVVVVVHANHAHEISPPVSQAMAALKHAGATLLNQAVLLVGVNDSVRAQTELSTALFAAGVMPYYLHMLDRVRGTHHFELDEHQAVALMQAVAAELPGYLVPRLAREEPGRRAKSVQGIPALTTLGTNESER